MRQVREAWWLVARHVGAGFGWLFPNFDAQDLHLWAGVGGIAIGAEQVYHPLVWIVPGVLFTYLAWPKRSLIKVKSRQES